MHGSNDQQEDDELPEFVNALKNSFIQGVLLVLVIHCFIYSFIYAPTWSAYEQTKIDTHKFQSTICRVEDIITEEMVLNMTYEMKTILIDAFFLIKVVNSTNKSDQFRVTEIPFLREPEQHSSVRQKMTQ